MLGPEDLGAAAAAAQVAAAGRLDAGRQRVAVLAPAARAAPVRLPEVRDLAGAMAARALLAQGADERRGGAGARAPQRRAGARAVQRGCGRWRAGGRRERGGGERGDGGGEEEAARHGGPRLPMARRG